ncbi:MAG: DUF1573 domain-containing protein [Marinifilum sp.]|jgi:hypothetical protein|nr:DUF1573 domain-containing protein [Marinifilum sp.]
MELNIKSHHKLIKKVYLILIVVICISFLFIGKKYIIYPIGEFFEPKHTTVEFRLKEIDLGKLKKGEPKEVCFPFTNTGEYPLIIKHIETSCNCAQTNWNKQPILPKNSGEIRIRHNAKKIGHFLKTILVFCNTEKGMVDLRIKGKVEITSKTGREQKLVTP